MQTRSKGMVIATFAGLAAAVGLWVVMSDAPSAPPTPKRPPLKAVKAIPLDISVAQGLNGDVPSQLLSGARPIRPVAKPMRKMDPRTQGAIVPPVQLPDIRLPPDVYRLDQGGIAAAVEGRRDALDDCYETAQFHNPGLEGKMTLALSLEPGPADPFGTVSAVAIDSDDGGMFAGCAKTVFDGAKFNVTEPTTVRYPLSFE